MLQNNNPKRKSNILFFIIPFLILGVTYFVCLFPAMGYDDGTNQSGKIFYEILSVITAPQFVLNPLVGSWCPGIVIHFVSLVIMSVGVSLFIKFSLFLFHSLSNKDVKD